MKSSPEDDPKRDRKFGHNVKRSIVLIDRNPKEEGEEEVRMAFFILGYSYAICRDIHKRAHNGNMKQYAVTLLSHTLVLRSHSLTIAPLTESGEITFLHFFSIAAYHFGLSHIMFFFCYIARSLPRYPSFSLYLAAIPVLHIFLQIGFLASVTFRLRHYVFKFNFFFSYT